MKYTRKECIVDASRYVKDGEIPVLNLIGLDTGGLHRENEHAKFDSYQRGVGTLIVKIGVDDEVEVKYGDWVLKHPDGEFSVWTNKQFKKTFIQIENI